MIKPDLASLSSAFALLGLFGCSPQSLGTGNPGRGEDSATGAVRDASVIDARVQIDFHGYIGGSFDAAACDCQIGADGVLRMSWDCFSTSYGNGSPELGWCGAPGQWTSACGLDVFSYDDRGLTQLFVYDKSGTEVGTQFANSSVGYVCPSDPTLTASKVAGGQFPDAACATVVCPCNSDRTFTCPAPDAGISAGAGTRDAAPLSF